MNDDLADKDLAALIARYPRLFSAGVRHPESWVEPGWTGIVDTLFQRIDERLSREPAVRFEMIQVKEKFGRLRVSFELETSDPGGASSLTRLQEDLDRYVEEARDRSRTTCERCGSAGVTIRKKGTVATLCDRHR